MELLTPVEIPDFGIKISHSSPVMFMGSCFASEIGQKCESGKIPVMINPHGTLFNPVSVSLALKRFAEGYRYSISDLYFSRETYYSLNHYTAFSSANPADLVARLNNVNDSSSEFLKHSTLLFVTFGTAWLFDLGENGVTVANCHKLPAKLFTRRQAGVEEIVNLWIETLDLIHVLNPALKVIFTVSPVRHLNDSVHGNQLSKATLLLACEKLLKHKAVAGYFPAYEIFMDELRDYRYYALDMLHPSESGIEYVWEKFSASFFTPETFTLCNEAEKILRAMNHRLDPEGKANIQFANSMISKINSIKKKAPFIDMEAEMDYFKSLSV
jgi:hypothetical protein